MWRRMGTNNEIKLEIYKGNGKRESKIIKQHKKSERNKASAELERAIYKWKKEAGKKIEIGKEGKKIKKER